MQAKDLPTAVAAVEEVGGEITHRLEIIHAVGARLSPAQARQVLELEGVVAVREDRLVSTESVACAPVGDAVVGFDGNRVTWNITNTGGTTLTVNGLTLSWPSANRDFKKVRLRGKEILRGNHAAPSATVTSGWRGSLGDRQIKAGQTSELKLEFERDAVAEPADYSIVVSFAEGCQVSWNGGGDSSPDGSSAGDEGSSSSGDGGLQDPGSEGTCEIHGAETLDINDTKVKWSLSSGESVIRHLDRIELVWPGIGDGLNKVRFGSEIYNQPTSASHVLITTGWRGNLDDRALESGRTKVLEFEFAARVNSDPSNYTLSVGFGPDCRVRFRPAGVLEDGFSTRETHFPTRIGADRLHAEGITGAGQTIAFLDTGNTLVSRTMHFNADRQWRYLAQYDARNDYLRRYGNAYFGQVGQDSHGHGGHITSLALSAKFTSAGKYNGVAPGADLVTIRAFDGDGQSTYLDVIRGIEWAVQNKDEFNIRVLNLSFSATPISHYWNDPLNQAVMAAWEAGIVVVASAGNTGPDPMTIGVPGNVPYIITVGAMSDGFTPGNPADDYLTSFSAAGPTFEGFVKPEIVAPGGHLLGRWAGTPRLAKAMRATGPDIRTSRCPGLPRPRPW